MFSKKKRETAKLLLLHDQSYCMVSGATRKEWEDEVVFPAGCALPFGTAVIDDRNGRLYHALRDYYAQFGIQAVRYDFSSAHHEYGYNPFAYIYTTYDASEFAAELTKQCFRLLGLRDAEALRIQKFLLTALVWRLHLDSDEAKHHPAALAELLWKVANGKTPDDFIKNRLKAAAGICRSGKWPRYAWIGFRSRFAAARRLDRRAGNGRTDPLACHPLL